MKKALALPVSILILFVLTFGSYTPGQAASQATIMPAGPINIAHFFKPPDMDPATAAKSFNMIVLTNGDHTYRDQLAASGFSSTIPEYFRFDSIQDPGGCTATPLNNQAAYKKGDFCYISANHPDWFLLDQYGKRITVVSGAEFYRMDPANDGWRAFFVARVLESQSQYGWSALFLDNVEGGLGKFYWEKPVKYSDNASYQKAVAGFLQYLHADYSQKYDRPIIGNIVALADDATWFTYLQYLSGAMKERFAVDWDETSYLSATRWEEDMTINEKTQANGKYVILVAPGNRSDLNRQTFAFASYLLINNGKAAFRYSTDDEYRNVWLYDNYKADLGTPLGPRYQSGSTWRRDFTNGYVVVNPYDLSASINVTGSSTFYDVPGYHWASLYVEKIYLAGITSGCSTRPRLYCPDGQVSRAEMAVFIIRGMHGSSYKPPAVGGSTSFGDVTTTHWAASWIKQLAAEGITGGCGGGNYCPSAPVTRGEMAVFLLRAKHGSSYQPSAVGGSTGFGDVPTTHWAASWIKQLAAEGITGGCGGGNYCPNSSVTRAEMTVFLVRTFQLP